MLHRLAANAALYDGYHAVARGMKIEDVIRLMGNPSSTNSMPVPYWDWESLPASEMTNINYTIIYPVPCAGIMAYMISLTRDGFVVSKHSYD